MYLSKLEIRNFRNFEAADIPLAGNVVLLGKIVSVKVICFSQFDWLLIPLCLIQPGSLSCQISGMAATLNQTLKLRCTLNSPISTVILPSQLC